MAMPAAAVFLSLQLQLCHDHIAGSCRLVVCHCRRAAGKTLSVTLTLTDEMSDKLPNIAD
jgi:hypothetical protein